MQLKSSVFEHQGSIPEQYTCEGNDMNPPLELIDIPSKAVSLVLIMDDPDVPASVRADRMWDHWVLYNIPPNTRHIQENGLSPPGVPGKNTQGTLSYIGPCPPDKEHRYFFKLYALDTLLSLEAGATKKEVLSAIEGHVIAYAELIGLYCKKHLRK